MLPIDLTVPLGVGTPAWPTYEPLQIKYFNFIEGGYKISVIPLKCYPFVGKAFCTIHFAPFKGLDLFPVF